MLTEGKGREYILTDHIILHFLELPKVEEIEMCSKIDRWLLYLKVEGRDNKMLKILLKDDDDLKMAHKRYETFTNNRKLRTLALSREKAERDKLYFENLARRKEAEGLAKGFETGRAEGRMKGQTEGRLEEKLETVKKMLAEGIDNKMISHISGLSESEIRKIEGRK